MKLAIVLVIGIAVGYNFGFKDAKKHDEDIVTRTVARVGGSSRDQVKNDIDRQMDALEKR